MTGPDRITQQYLRRWPESKKSRAWAGRMVHIETEHGVWRHEGMGYTWAGTPDAGVWSFEDAQREVSHCGPEKRAAFIWVNSVTSCAQSAPDPRVAALVEAARVDGWRAAIDTAAAKLDSFATTQKDQDGEPSIHIRAAAAEVRLLAALTPKDPAT
jgi:hypothetical protein